MSKHGDHEAWRAIAKGLPAFETTYDEGLKVGYKWYDAEGKQPLFPFGYGLSYTSYSYSNLSAMATVTKGGTSEAPGLLVTFKLANNGSRSGSEVAEVHAALPASAGEPPKRLIGWSKVKLAAGESKEVALSVDPLFLSVFDEAKNGWQLVPGEYTIFAGGSSRDLPLQAKIQIK